ncbi:Heat shock protein DnaJ, cysteine-rich domain-containing protein [Heracleum sosnowskyi]|uniref:Heat shock protein DnaJ, cysteine-rich domain-containing protein n=1 Tax=Heracleum sosnowskyi TaxID=360622 RepID=A0AAD8N091_9APIA|nr:Heat shock protein DnaJ, cysteine-rich domain-containing protein [Heracleum sosnowskyi]
MASISPLQAIFSTNSAKQCGCFGSRSTFLGSNVSLSQNRIDNNKKKNRSLTVVAAVGDVSADGTVYLIAGAAAVALLGTAFPILFSRKDLCPECDGAGFVRKGGSALRANAARKDQLQIVCANCNGLGKLNQVDK